MDEYGPVNVTRSTEPDGDLDDEDLWTPSSPSNASNPYDGSPLTISTSSPVQLTALLVEKKDGDETPIKVAVRVKPVGSDEFEPVNNPDSGSPLFEVTPGEKFPLPEGMPLGSKIEVYVIEPVSNLTLSVTPFGCEYPGKCINEV